jgi:hypothetical protein
MRNQLRTVFRICKILNPTGIALIVLSLLLAACDLDVENPNALPQEQVLTTDEGILALAVGMQDLFAENVEEFIQAPALVTDEWGTGTRSLQAYQLLLTGEGLDNDFGVVETPWASAYRVVVTANNLIDNAPQVGLDPGATTGVVALAKLFKAMALGTIIQQYERIIIDVDAASPQLQPREVVFDTVLSLLESARTDAAGLSEANRSFLRTRILGTGFDLDNTIDAMLARYYLFDDQFQQAIDAAERVDLGVLSVFPYTAPDVNPIFNLSGGGLAYVFPLASFAAEAEPGDERVPFWVDTEVEPFTGNPDSLLLPLNMYGERGDPFLVYVPDEMTLIRAEAHTRLGNLDRARELINEVRTRTTIEPVANLPALPPEALDTDTELLNQIAYERRYELYEQGLRWEDMRRLGEFIEEEPTYQFLPIPRQECVTNPALDC